MFVITQPNFSRRRSPPRGWRLARGKYIQGKKKKKGKKNRAKVDGVEMEKVGGDGRG